ncbi:MAG: LamG domain-containing protein [Mariniphaga sp.]
MIKKDKAFTLVELLVVVAVLALLASIVFSNLTGAREQAKISNALSFQSNMHNLLGADLVGWWNFDEGSGSVAKDSSGYGNDGIIVGATHTDGVPGTLGSALDFNGVTNSYVRISSFNGLQGKSQATISFWTRENVITSGDRYPLWANSNVLIAFGTTEPDNMRVRWNLQGDWRDQHNIYNILQEKVWYHWIVTFNLGLTTIYVNGDVEGGGTNTQTTISDVSTNYDIGYRSGSSYVPFNGLIDDVRIYSRALTAYEVQTLYAQTKGKYLSEKVN